MSIDSQNYSVNIEDFTKTHYIKSFKNKYKKAWDITEKAIIDMLKRVDRVIGTTSKAEIIKSHCNKEILKLDFSVAGTNVSAKRSGNRAIVYVDHDTLSCKILLIYSKNEISPPGETQKWTKIIIRNYFNIWSEFP